MLQPGRSYFVNKNFNFQELLLGTELIDRIIVDGESLQIKDARQIISQASQQPFGSTRVLLLENADIMSEAIQNTFLKLLEEPPSFLANLLIGESIDSFLPTVRSRLHPILGSVKEVDASPFPEFLSTEQSARKLLESVKDRAELIKKLEGASSYFRNKVLSDPSVVTELELLVLSIRRLRQNANQKLVVDALLLNWPFN